jgi:hypothetical protein
MFSSAILIAGILPSLVFAQAVGETVASSSADSAAADSALQREYARLAQLLNSNDVFDKREAAQTLLRVRPSDVANADTRKLIARGYRSLAMEQSGLNQDTAIRGLAIWGGKHSVPVLIELMDKSQHRVPDEVFTAWATQGSTWGRGRGTIPGQFFQSRCGRIFAAANGLGS